MLTVLWLLTIQGAIGAFDTLYFHEWRARLPGRGRSAAPELRIHAVRDFSYALLFGSLPWIEWHGSWVVVLFGVLMAEILLTLVDFVVEIRVRKPMGDVSGGERIAHAVMAIVYGGMLAHLLPAMWQWWPQQTALVPTRVETSAAVRWTLSVMGAGVSLSGMRDLYAALGLPGGDWPWTSGRSQEERVPV